MLVGGTGTVQLQIGQVAFTTTVVVLAGHGCVTLTNTVVFVHCVTLTIGQVVFTMIVVLTDSGHVKLQVELTKMISVVLTKIVVFKHSVTLTIGQVAFTNVVVLKHSVTLTIGQVKLQSGQMSVMFTGGHVTLVMLAAGQMHS